MPVYLLILRGLRAPTRRRTERRMPSASASSAIMARANLPTRLPTKPSPGSRESTCVPSVPRPEDFRRWARCWRDAPPLRSPRSRPSSWTAGYLLPAGDLEGYRGGASPRARRRGPAPEVGLLHDWLCVRRAPTPRPPRHARTRLHPCRDALGVMLVNGAAAGAWTAPLRGVHGGRAEHVRSS